MNTSVALSPVSGNERLAAVIAHAGTWVSWFLAPLCVYVLKRGESRYVEFHALQALIWSIIGTIASALTCGLALPVFLGFHIYAAWKIWRGEDYEYPLAGDLARSRT